MHMWKPIGLSLILLATVNACVDERAAGTGRAESAHSGIQPGAHERPSAGAPGRIASLLPSPPASLPGAAPTIRTLADPASGGEETVEYRLLVRFEPEAAREAVAALHEETGARLVRTLRSPAGLQVLGFSSPDALRRARGVYDRSPLVRYTEPETAGEVRAITSFVTPDDPKFLEQWSLENTGQNGGRVDSDLNAVAAWQGLKSAETVVVGVVDTGVDYTHPDLAAAMWRNPGEIAGNRVDDDGNGYVDDIHGIDAIGQTGDPMDVQGHGTHVAGIIAAIPNNGQGISGVAPNARIAACRAGDPAGAMYAGAVAQCLDYFHALATREKNPVPVVVTNHSWKGSSFSRALEDAIAGQLEADILLSAAAGNDGEDMDTRFGAPAGYDFPHVLSASATGRSDELPDFSNYGGRSILLGAPGVDIVSTYPGNRYAAGAGTSFAAPHVSGLVALVRGARPGISSLAARNLVVSGAVGADGMQGNTLSGRRIRAWDSGGAGSLTCDGRTFRRRLAPYENRDGVALFAWNEPLPIRVLNTRCDVGAGAVTATVEPGNVALQLRDTGGPGDREAGDGEYANVLRPGEADRYDVAVDGGPAFTAVVLDGYAVPEKRTVVVPRLSGSPLRFNGDGLANVTAPFPILLGNQTYGIRELLVSRRGFVAFENGDRTFYPRAARASASDNPALGAHEPPLLAAPLWDLFEGGTVVTSVQGSAPERTLTIEWQDVTHAECGGRARFQVVFTEGSPEIRFGYGEVPGGSGSCAPESSATVGLATGNRLISKPADGDLLSAGLELVWRLAPRPALNPADPDNDDGTSAPVPVPADGKPADDAAGGPQTAGSDPAGGGCATSGTASASTLLLAAGALLLFRAQRSAGLLPRRPSRAARRAGQRHG